MSTSKPSVLVAAKFLPRLLGQLADHYALHGLESPEPDAVPPEARDARAIITIGGLKSDAALMDALPKLGLIACYGTGYEGVDRAAASLRTRARPTPRRSPSSPSVSSSPAPAAWYGASASRGRGGGAATSSSAPRSRRSWQADASASTGWDRSVPRSPRGPPPSRWRSATTIAGGVPTYPTSTMRPCSGSQNGRTSWSSPSALT